MPSQPSRAPFARAAWSSSVVPGCAALVNRSPSISATPVYVRGGGPARNTSTDSVVRGRSRRGDFATTEELIVVST